MPVLSRHNIISRLRDSEGGFIVNLLSRNADLLEPERLRELAAGRWQDGEELAAKGYLVEPGEELGRYRRAYLDFLDARERSEVQVFFVPGYACNFACSYCYQEGYGQEAGGPGPGRPPRRGLAGASTQSSRPSTATSTASWPGGASTSPSSGGSRCCRAGPRGSASPPWWTGRRGAGWTWPW